MMNKALFSLSFGAVLFLAGCGSSETEATTDTETSATGTVSSTESTNPPGGDVKTAKAVLEGKSGSTMMGEAVFTQQGGVVSVDLHLEGISPGKHGVHLHEKGDCSAPDAKSAGDHWNPTSEDHGHLGTTEKAHFGDLGNIEVGPDGHSHLTFQTDKWTIGGDEGTNIVGKAIVVHAGEDDLKTQPSGNSGDRIGCGVVSE